MLDAANPDSVRKPTPISLKKHQFGLLKLAAIVNFDLYSWHQARQMLSGDDVGLMSEKESEELLGVLPDDLPFKEDEILGMLAGGQGHGGKGLCLFLKYFCC